MYVEDFEEMHTGGKSAAARAPVDAKPAVTRLN
jgi:hypothetical protein